MTAADNRVVEFPGAVPRFAARPANPQACPLCGGPTWPPARDASDFYSRPHLLSGCRLGTCTADPAPGTPEAARIAWNREILRGDLIEVEFSIVALQTATYLARRRGNPVGDYLEQMFPLALRKRVLEGYMRSSMGIG